MLRILIILTAIVSGCSSEGIEVMSCEECCLNIVEGANGRKILTVSYFVKNNTMDSVELYETSIGTCYPDYLYQSGRSNSDGLYTYLFDRSTNYKYDSINNIELTKVTIPPGYKKRFEYIVSGTVLKNKQDYLVTMLEFKVNNKLDTIDLKIDISKVSFCDQVDSFTAAYYYDHL